MRVNFLIEARGKHTRCIPTAISRISGAIGAIARQILHVSDALVHAFGQQVLRHLREIFRVQNQRGITIELVPVDDSRLIEDALHGAL